MKPIGPGPLLIENAGRSALNEGAIALKISLDQAFLKLPGEGDFKEFRVFPYQWLVGSPVEK